MTIDADVADDLTAALTRRDRWGRPLILPRGGEKPVPYLRPSSIGKMIEHAQAVHIDTLRQELETAHAECVRLGQLLHPSGGGL